MNVGVLKTAALALGFFSCVLIAYIVMPWAVKIRIKSRISSRLGGGAVALTFDDGPDGFFTPVVLDTLRQFRMCATFFVLGRNAESHPQIIRRMLAEGHEVGEHGYSHCHPWKTGPGAFLRDLIRGNAAVMTARGGTPASLYRPAYGKLNLLSLVYALIWKKRFVFWSIDPRDYMARSPEDVVEYIGKRLSPRTGGIILLHDARRSKALGDAGLTAAALKGICSSIRSAELKCVTISGLFGEVEETH